MSIDAVVPSRFVSLRWKFILSLILMLLLVSLVIGVLAIRRFDQQLDQVLQQQQQILQRDYQLRLRAEEERLIVISQELNLTLRDGDDTLQIEQMRQRIEQNWGDFELFWRLRGLLLVDEQYEVLMSVGSALPMEQSWLASSFNRSEPVQRVRCQNSCFIEVAVPILVAGEVKLLVFVSGLEEVLGQLVENHQVQLALISGAQGGQGPWQRQVLSLTNRSSNMRLLSETSSQLSLDEISSAPQRLSLYHTNWVFFGWSVSPSNDTLLLFRDIDLLAGNERAFRNELLGMLAAAVLIAGGVGIALFWAPLARLRRLGVVLPMLAQSRFDDLRERLQRRRSWFADELGQLEVTTLEVANQLERLESDVERYTDELQRMAMMDALTGLPNRAMFHHELGKALGAIGRTDEQIALLFLDLDEFKRINDTLGHDIGDELLKTVANRLQKSVRSMDTVCRLGGDEFTVIVRGLESESDIHRIIHQIFTSLQQPLQLGRNTLIITTSIGVVFCDNPMVRPEELLKRADLAMYQAKQAGRSNYRVFNDQMLESASRRLQLEQEIRSALSDEQLRLSLQPIVSMDSGRIIGFEGLCRWHHPKRGLVMPEEFMAEVEGSEQGIELGYRMLEQAVEILARLTKTLERDDFFVSLNLSPSQYLHTSLVERLGQALERHHVAPARLMLELTEEVLIKSLDRAMNIMHQLKSMGLKIAIDDFGTGYSSLSYLKQLPFDVLKVDRGFVADLDNSDVDRNIVTSVIDLAHNLKRTVVAEGVESHDQHQFLLKARCDYAQGYLYAAAMEERQLMKALAQVGPKFIWRDWRSDTRIAGRAGKK
ncbi:putative bifunctional diguanylate cyclase/phosphodiesterase [Ferrimonas senticii]|uniref:putative bifunctional diguanylate cyclase/phosphodiesterase n=1 Tax=Ferrimonas senticii TaxID=394566 RepID=UPI0003FAEA4F|nr:bifunctional diguanylate cyclase/phosphodiesterase [Ferrimonas senticii]